MNETEKMKTYPYKPLAIGSTLEQQIEKKAVTYYPASCVHEPMIKVSDVLGLVADYVCIPRKQLIEIRDKLQDTMDSDGTFNPYNLTHPFVVFWHGKIVELLEDSK